MATYARRRRPPLPRHWLCPCLVLAVSLLGLTATASEAISYRIRKPIGNLYFQDDWRPDAQWTLSIRRGENQKEALNIQIEDGELTITSRLPGKTPRRYNRHVFRAAGLPMKARERAQFVIKFRESRWTLYCGDEEFLHLAPPFLPPAVLVLHPQNEARTNDSLRFQKVDHFRFESDFLVPEGQENPLGDWQIISGTWQIHSAHEDAVEQNTSTRLTQQPLEAGRSPNLYSLKGSTQTPVETSDDEKAKAKEGAAAENTETPAAPATTEPAAPEADPPAAKTGLIVNGYSFQDAYYMQASVLTQPGTMGLVFLFQDAEHYFSMLLDVPKQRDAQTVIRVLRHRLLGDAPVTQTLATVAVDLPPNQWVMPRVEARHNRIDCYLDNEPIMSVDTHLPPGGKFGLAVASDHFVRFDDVAMATLGTLRLQNKEAIRFHTAVDEGPILQRSANWFFQEQDADGYVKIKQRNRPQWALFTPMRLQSHLFSVTYAPSSKDHTLGLLYGYGDDTRAYFRFICERRGDNEHFRLEKVLGNVTKPVESWQTKAANVGKEVTLHVDGSEGDVLRFYRDGTLVALHHSDVIVEGASGVFAGPRSPALIAELRYEFAPQLQKNKREKNQLFITDPFMRHWSSPEGEWIADEEKRMWHKSDFFGRFEVFLPSPDGSELHVGIGEGETDGAWKTQVKGNTLQLLQREQTEPAASATLPDPSTMGSAYKLHYEGHYLWATDEEDKLLFRHRLEQPLSGTRMRLAGLTEEALMKSYVERYQVKDYLFTEAPHDWVKNGGKWQIINRFQCQPRWSHMNGQNKEGLAALWTKYVYSGDFCIEVYAGIRHGEWYKRCGDINMTMMNQQNSPSQGYTITCTGWDFNHSQLWTRFYRNGELLDQSDRYTIPRHREGNKRVWQNPLLNAGRPVHGAWYYLKLRRIGKKLQYYFDNKLIFETEDEAPLQDGTFGLWTFRNSMMVARVKVAAQSIKPKRLHHSPVRAKPPTMASQPELQGAGTFGAHEHRPDNWHVDDPIGNSYLTWHQHVQHGRYFVLTNRLGGGDAHATCKMPPIPYRDLAGFRFYVKCNPEARFNFHYRVGTVDTEGKFQTEKRFYHRLTGTDFNRGPTRIYGETPLTPVSTTRSPWHRHGEFVPVDVWLPAEGLMQTELQRPLMVQIDGFGNLQPSYVTNGLKGNGAGAAYAIAGFTPIAFRPPQIELTLAPAEEKVDLDSAQWKKLILGPKGKLITRTTSLVKLQETLRTLDQPGLQSATLRVLGPKQRVYNRELVWLRLPTTPEVTCQWSDRANTVEFDTKGGYPDRRLGVASASCDNLALALREDSAGNWRAVVPLTAMGKTRDTLPIRVSLDYRSVQKSFCPSATDDDVDDPTVQELEGPLDLSFELPTRSPVQEPPTLASLDGLSPFFINFDSRTGPDKALRVDPARMRVEHHDEFQGSYLHVFNNKRGDRMGSLFSYSHSLAHYPLLQFRYRSSEMTKLSLSVGSKNKVTLGESFPATTARLSKKLTNDEQWHSWQGIVSDGIHEYAYSPNIFLPGQLNFSSFHGTDQTGRYSHWHLDDLVFGPAVSAKQPLVFTPDYIDPDGIYGVYVCIRQGPSSYAELTDDERDGLSWQEIKNRNRFQPDLQSFPDGVHHVFIRSADHHGRVSQVTDVPFLLDTTPPTVSHKVRAIKHPVSNGTQIDIHFATGEGAPLALKKLHFTSDGKPVKPGTFLNRFNHQTSNERLRLNWPHIFRKRLDGMKDGDTFTLEVRGIEDGAGNAAEDLVIPLKVDFKADTQGPALLPTKYGAAIKWHAGWEGRETKGNYFTPASHNRTEVKHNVGEAPYLFSGTHGANGTLTLTPQEWKVSEHPLLSLRIRIPTLKKVVLSLILTDKNNKAHRLILRHPDAAKQKKLPAPIAWADNQWFNVTVNVADLIKDADGIISKLEIKRGGADNKDPMHIESAFIHGAWAADQTITMNAYDASGVSGLRWEYVDRNDAILKKSNTKKLTITPTALGITPVQGGWLLIYVRDQTGKDSVPLRVPYSSIGG